MKPAIILTLLLACCSCARQPDSSPAGPSAVALAAVFKTAGGQEMILIPAGEFLMGSSHGQLDEAPPHKVRVNAFLMDRTEVTQEMYEKLRLMNPSKVKGPKLPVHMMSWVLAARYCNQRSKAEGLEPCYDEENATCDFARNGYRLPTEAEWEYACRAGGETESIAADPNRLRNYGWFTENAGGKPHPVAEKQPNAWGLYDMLGNVGEWCNDMYDQHYYGNAAVDNPRGPEQGDLYTVRGGAYNGSAEALRPSARRGENPGFSDACLAPETLGFRCVRKPTSAQPGIQ